MTRSPARASRWLSPLSIRLDSDSGHDLGVVDGATPPAPCSAPRLLVSLPLLLFLSLYLSKINKFVFFKKRGREVISCPRPVQLMSFPHGSRTHNRENTLCFPGGVHGILYVVLGLFLFSFLISKSPIMAVTFSLCSAWKHQEASLEEREVGKQKLP